jgi:hypothetical protein
VRSSRKRKLSGIRTKQVNVVVAEQTYDKLSKIAGPASLGETVETLVEREFNRRVRKMMQNNELQ